MSQTPMTLQTSLEHKLFAWRRWLLLLIVATLMSGGLWWAKETGRLDHWLDSTTMGSTRNTNTIDGAFPTQSQAVATLSTTNDTAAPVQSAAVTDETTTPVETTATTTDATADTKTVEAVIAPRSLVAVAGIDGVQLWNAEGQLVSTLAIGAKLQATARTADGQWLIVEAAHGSGWAQAAQVVAFDLNELAVTDLAAPRTANNQPDATSSPATNTTTTETAAPVVTTETQARATVTTATVTTATVTTSKPAAAATAAQTMRATVATSGANLNVRSGPSTSTDLTTKIANGAKVVVSGRDESSAWVQIQLSADMADTGWVAAQYLQLDSALDDLPVVTTVVHE